MLSDFGVPGRGGRRAVTVLGAVGLSLAAALPAASARTATVQTTPELLGISVQSYSTYDRVVLDVSSIPAYTVTPTDELMNAASGQDVTLPGSTTYLDVELHPAGIVGFSGATRVTTGFSEVAAVARLSAYEGYVQVGIGLDHASGYTVTAISPTELAIDVAH